MPATQAKRTISEATRRKMRLAARRRVKAQRNGSANGGTTLAARRKELDAASSIIDTLAQLPGEARTNVLRLIFGAKSKVHLS